MTPSPSSRHLHRATVLLVLATLAVLSGCAGGAGPGATPPPAPARAAATSTPTGSASPADTSSDGRPSVDAVEARRLSPRRAAVGAARIAVPPGWKVDWVGVGYLHMGPGHFRYSGGAFAVVASAMASDGLEAIGGGVLGWLRAQPDVTVRALRPVVLGGRRHPAVLVQGSAQVCGSPVDSPEAAHHSCINARGSVLALVPVGTAGAEGRTLVVSVGARPLGRRADEAAVADRRERLQQLVDLVTLP